MEKKKIGLIVSIAVLAVFIIWLYFVSAPYNNNVLNVNQTNQSEPEIITDTNESAQIANPASEFCEARGYISEIVTAEDGSQSGICKAPSGKECDEWAYYRGNCTLA